MKRYQLQKHLREVANNTATLFNSFGVEQELNQMIWEMNNSLNKESYSDEEVRHFEHVIYDAATAIMNVDFI